MKRPTQPLLLLVVLVVVAGVLAHVLSTGSPELPPETADTAKEAPEDLVMQGRGQALPTDPDRRIQIPSDPSRSDLPQGVRGLVADPQGYPLANAKVYLMPAIGSNAFQVLEQKRQGMRFLPVAQMVTKRDGRFALGLEWQNDDDRFELRVVHERFCERSLPALRIHSQDWYDAGTIRLKRGIAVWGRVTAKASGFPIADARVSISNPNGLLRLAETPGHEDGLVAHTRADGSYRIANVDPHKSYRIRAVAPDFARQERSSLILDPEADTRVDFQLSAGCAIAGIITSATGQPIPHAKVTAYPLSQKVLQREETRTDAKGRFEVLGLQQGSYTLLAESPGFIRGEDKPIPTGTMDVHIVLERQGQVIVQAIGKNGRPLHDYTIHLRTWFSNSPMPGPTKIHKRVRGAPSGVATLEGLDPMDYIVEVRAKGHAKAFSAPFRIVAGPKTTPRVTVHLGEGGVLEGIVLDDRGNPLPKVAVQTLPNHHVDNEFIRKLGIQVPHRITKTRVETDAQGRFRIPFLNDGKYQLQFTHRDYCNLFTKGHEILSAHTTNLGQIQMLRGALLDGIARLEGVARGQLKVTVTRLASSKEQAPSSFTCETVTGNSGHFVLNKRLPPGDYEARGADQLAHFFVQMLQWQQSLVRFQIGAGQHRHHLQIRIPAGAK